MTRASTWSGLWIGALASVLALAVLALGATLWGLPFVPFDVFEWMTRLLPGVLVTTGIDTIVTVISTLGIHPTAVAAKLAEEGMALASFVLGSAFLGAIVARAGRHTIVAGLAAGVVWIAFAAFAGEMVGVLSVSRFAWLAIVLLGWGGLVGILLRSPAVADREHATTSERRRFLASAGGIAVLSAVMLGFSALARRGRRALGGARTRIEVTGTSGPAASPAPAALAARIAPVHGTRPELTANEDFYRIDINLQPPRVDPITWRLVVDGLVDRRLSLALDDLRALPAVTQAITLECISNRLGGDLIGTSLWTGVRLRDVLARAGLREGVRAVHVRAADGFYESVGEGDMNDPRTLLVYAMNHEPLPEAHGFPLRIYIPNRHGMKQPKWITSLHVSDRDGAGYWPDRGWSKDAIPHTTSVIDTVGMSMLVGDSRVLPIGGIAYAGARGIRKVEVQVDHGPWSTAQLVAPPIGPLCWVLWRYDWPYVRGHHDFRVRAYDGSGALQSVDEQPPHPDGATGIHTVTTNV